MPTNLVFPTLPASDKTPGVYNRSLFGRGKGNVGNSPVFVAVLAHMLTGGTLTANTSAQMAYTPDEVDAFAGATSELALAGRAVLESGLPVLLVPVLEPAGAAAATLIITFAGTWTGVGEWQLELDGEVYSFSTGATFTTCAANLAAAVNGKVTWCTAGSTAGAATITTKNKGIRQLRHMAKLTRVSAPSGCTVAIAGGTATSSGLTPFVGATGTDDVSNVVALLKTIDVPFIAAAQSDATGAGLLRDHVVAELDPLIEHLEQLVICVNDTLANATTLAQTTLNSVQCQVLWGKNSKEHPTILAARFAGARASAESTNPNQRYDGTFGDAPAVVSSRLLEKLDQPLHSEVMAALNAGITPLMNINGRLQVVKSVTTRSLSGSVSDYTTDSTNKVSVPFRVRREIAAAGVEYVANNPYVSDDPPEGTALAPEGVATPRLWGGVVNTVLDQCVKNLWLDADQTAANPAVPFFNATAKRIETVVPCFVLEHQNQLLNQVEQTAF